MQLPNNFIQRTMMRDIQLKNILMLIMIVMFTGLTGCPQPPTTREEITKFNSLKTLKPSGYPIFTDYMDYQDLTRSIDMSLVYFKRVPLTREYRYAKDIVTAEQMIAGLVIFKEFLDTHPSSDALNEFIRSRFRVYKSVGNEADGQVLFTGYYEPTYAGSLKKEGDFIFPVYSKPNDILQIDLSLFNEKYKGHSKLVARVNKKNKVIPYFSRKEINAQEKFHKKSIPVAWLKSRVDRFFLEIQGSGRVVLDDGEILRVHYAGSNGNAYRSVGRYLIDKNEVKKEDMSMQAIRKWLEKNPQRMDEVLHFNKSFVFFKEEKGGPYGCLGVEVTPLRSIAMDQKLFPRGALCYMTVDLPEKKEMENPEDWKTKSFFVLNQDTGGAIKGPARADLFCGNGEYAEFTAGHMNKYGQLFFLVPAVE
ncbi:MAG: murein transglycosylase [Desulfobacteraceae bacterium]|nr:murein transglycosylase [Desulfobacteraceae bacterium]